MIRPAREIDEHTPWQEMTLGGEIYEPATARYVNTGAWRTDTPVLDTGKCRHCLLCVPYCPTAPCPSRTESWPASITCTARAAASAPRSAPLGPSP